jgi:hypothetical protein
MTAADAAGRYVAPRRTRDRRYPEPSGSALNARTASVTARSVGMRSTLAAAPKRHADQVGQKEEVVEHHAP